MKTKIELNKRNIDEINAAIKEAEGRARVRKITAEELLKIATIMKDYSRLTYDELAGIEFTIDINCVGTMSRSYNGTPDSTQAKIIVDKRKWYITHIFRGAAWGYNIVKEAVREVKIDEQGLEHIEYEPAMAKMLSAIVDMALKLHCNE